PLTLADRGEVEPAIDRGVEGGQDARLGMAEQAGGVLATKVDIAVMIHVLEDAAFTARHCRWKRCIEQHRAGVAARKTAARMPMDGGTGRTQRIIALPRLGKRAVEVAVAARRWGHRADPSRGASAIEGQACLSLLAAAN